MRVRIIASKPREEGEADITDMIGESFDVARELPEGRVLIDHGGALGFSLYPDEYEVIEQREGI